MYQNIPMPFKGLMSVLTSTLFALKTFANIESVNIAKERYILS